MIPDITKLSAHGTIVMRDAETSEVLRTVTNAIHFPNLSVALAKALSGSAEGHIKFMSFGNGASSIADSGNIVYRTPNVDANRNDLASLYNETYFKDVSVNDNGNNVRFVLNNTNYADVVTVCTLDFGEPSGQNVIDNAANIEERFVFDEIGLRVGETYEDSVLITHAIFSPFEKSLNRIIEIEYTIRIQMG